MMKSTLTNFIFCAVGAAVGSVVTWKLTQEYYKKLADKEIADVKEAYDRVFKIAMKDEPEEEEEYQPTESDIRENESIIESQGYTQYSNIARDVKKVERPYIITPDEFSELYDYETISLIHFADGVLTDDQYELVEDVDDVVGDDYAEHFGENEGDEDSVYVRNDRLKADFEIMRDLRTRSEAINPSPHPTEDE